MDRSGLGGKSGGHSVYNFFIRAAALSTHICISILPRSVGKRNWGWKTLLAAYIYRSETGGVGPNRDRGSATTVFCSFTFTYLGNQLPQSPFLKTLVVSFGLSQSRKHKGVIDN